MSAGSKAKYRWIADELRRHIHQGGLRPGDALPPQRELAEQYGVALMTVRQTLTLLRREGLVELIHGRGTFVAQPRPRGGRKRRLGLLLVDMGGRESPFLRSLSLSLLERVQQAGDEMIIDRIETEQLMAGELPAMVQRESVDGFFVYGWVHDHHFRCLARQPLPYILVGNRPVSPQVPQVSVDFEQLAYELTGALRQAGRERVWLDTDPAHTDYSIGLDLLRGYSRAVQEPTEGGEGTLRLCLLRTDRVGEVADRLVAAGLRGAAIIVEDWSASLLRAALQARSPDADQLLIVPLPAESIRQAVQGPNVVQWSRYLSADLLAEPAVAELARAVEQQDRPHSCRLDLTCELVALAPTPRMELGVTPRRLDPAAAPEAEPSTARSGLV